MAHYESAYLVLAASRRRWSSRFIRSSRWIRGLPPPRMAHDDLSALFRRGRDLLRVRDGADAHGDLRTAFRLEHIVTLRHFDYMAKIMLVTGSMVGFAYSTEFFTAWYSGNPYEFFTFLNRAGGPYAWAYWIMVSCNVISPQVFWFKKARTSIPILFVMSIIINIGMWFERFVIIVTSLHRDFLPSAWGYFVPTIWTSRVWSEASGSSSRCSACSCAFFRWWQPPRSRPSCRRPIRITGPASNAKARTAGPRGRLIGRPSRSRGAS